MSLDGNVLKKGRTRGEGREEKEKVRGGSKERVS